MPQKQFSNQITTSETMVREAASDVNYDWKPNGPKQFVQIGFWVYLPIKCIGKDKMNIDYTKMQRLIQQNKCIRHT